MKWKLTSWLRAPPVPKESKAEWEHTHTETSATIRRTFLFILGASIYCAITLAGSSDSRLIRGGDIVKLPVLNYEVNFNAFLIGAPMILIGLYLYLHIFIAEHRLHPPPQDKIVPMLGNFKQAVPQFVAWLLYYWLVPATLAMFAWKVFPIEDYDVFTLSPDDEDILSRYFKLHIILTGALAISSLALQIRRGPREWLWIRILFLFCFFLIGALLFLYALTHRQLDLRWANLSEENLAGIKIPESLLRGANLRKAILSEADLTGANLIEANLFGAHLDHARLDMAKLERANIACGELANANLDNTDMDEVDLSYANLENSTLYNVRLYGATLIGANFRNSKVEGERSRLVRADFSGANLTDINWVCVDMRQSILTGGVRMARAKLTGDNSGNCDFDLSGSKLASVNMSGAVVSGVNFDSADMTFANLNATTISDSDFQGADLSHATFLGSVEIYRSNFSNTILHHAEFNAANVVDSDFSSAEFKNANLARSYFKDDVTLENASFENTELVAAQWPGIDASYANINASDLREIDLSGANLEGIQMEGVDLKFANLSGANLSQAILADVTLRGTILVGAHMPGAELHETIDLQQSQLDQSCGDADTRLPPGLSIKLCKQVWEKPVSRKTVSRNFSQTFRDSLGETANEQDAVIPCPLEEEFEDTNPEN